MKKKTISLLQLLVFIPTALTPAGLYLGGDKHIFSVKNIEGEYTAYRVPSDKKGGTFTLNEKTDTPLYVYVNKDKEEFETKMNPPITEDVAITNNIYSLSDKKLLCLVHYLLKTEFPNRRFSVRDTANIMEILDEALQLRSGNQSKYVLNQTRWQSIKEAVEESICSREVTMTQSKTSLIPRQVQTNRESE